MHVRLCAVPVAGRDDEWVESLLLVESVICDRAGISLDETEQGLTPNAVVAINEWVTVHA